MSQLIQNQNFHMAASPCTQSTSGAVLSPQSGNSVGTTNVVVQQNSLLTQGQSQDSMMGSWMDLIGGVGNTTTKSGFWDNATVSGNYNTVNQTGNLDNADVKNPEQVVLPHVYDPAPGVPPPPPSTPIYNDLQQKGDFDSAHVYGTGVNVNQSGNFDSTQVDGVKYSDGTSPAESDSVTQSADCDSARVQGNHTSVTQSGANDSADISSGNQPLETLVFDPNTPQPKTTVSQAGRGDQLSVKGDNATVKQNGNNESASISGNNDSLQQSGVNSQATVSGDGDDVQMSGNNNNVSVQGSNVKVQVNGSNIKAQYQNGKWTLGQGETATQKSDGTWVIGRASQPQPGGGVSQLQGLLQQILGEIEGGHTSISQMIPQFMQFLQLMGQMQGGCDQPPQQPPAQTVSLPSGHYHMTPDGNGGFSLQQYDDLPQGSDHYVPPPPIDVAAGSGLPLMPADVLATLPANTEVAVQQNADGSTNYAYKAPDATSWLNTYQVLTAPNSVVDGTMTAPDGAQTIVSQNGSCVQHGHLPPAYPYSAPSSSSTRTQTSPTGAILTITDGSLGESVVATDPKTGQIIPDQSYQLN